MAFAFTARQKLEILNYAKTYGEKLAAQKFNCHERSIFRWKNIYDGTIQSLDNKYCAPHTPHPKAHTEKEIENIKEVMRKNPYITHKELYQILKQDYGYNRHPGGLYNYLRRNRIIPEPKLKNNYSTMFDGQAVKRLNGKFLFNNKSLLPRYLIELDNKGIYIAREENNNPCKLTIYYSTALVFDTKESAEDFVNSIQNTSDFVLSVKELIY